MDKLQGSKVLLYSRSKTPLMFTPDAKSGIVLPSLYLLFQIQDLPLLRVYLKQGVEQFIFNGADLMWPGIKSINNETFRQNDIAVIYALNQTIQESQEVDQTCYVPIAVGRTITNRVPESQKGKAIEVEHYLFDELWNMGTKKIPEQIKMIQTELSQPQEEDQKLDTPTSKNESQEESKEGEQIKEQEEEKKGEEQPEDAPEVPIEEMDPRIIEAFMRSIIEGVQDASLPMEPSDFQKDYLSLYQAEEFKLDLRNSSFRRVGKLLEVMSKKGLLTYAEAKGLGHKVITSINRKHQEFADFKPQYKLKQVKKQEVKPQEASSDGYPKIQIDEVYALSKHFNTLLGNVKQFQKKPYYDIKECRDIIHQYVFENYLDQNCTRGCIRADPILNQIMDKSQVMYNNEIKKGDLFKNLYAHLIEYFQITQLDQEQLIKERSKVHKGQVPKVKILSERVQNKKQTSIKGLELYQIDQDELVSFLSQKCSASVTLQKIETSQNLKQEPFIVKVQGNQIGQVVQILTEKYKVPLKYIITEDKVGKGKKKR